MSDWFAWILVLLCLAQVVASFAMPVGTSLLSFSKESAKKKMRPDYKSIYNKDKLHVGLFGLVDAASNAVLEGMGIQPKFKDILEKWHRIPYKIPLSFNYSEFVSIDDSLYVARPQYGAEIEFAMTVSPAAYYIIYGPSGAGKSILVEKIAKNKTVVKYDVRSIQSQPEVVSNLTELLFGVKSDKVSFLINALHAIKEHDGIIPTIVFDCQTASTTIGSLAQIRSVAKSIMNFARCLIVLSDENDVVCEFGKDRARERFIYVNEMSNDEAKELLKRRGANFTEEEMQYVFENVGTNPMELVALHELHKYGKTSVKEFVADTLGHVEQQLVKFPFQPILAALKEHPEGVRPKYFNKAKYEGVDLSNEDEVGKAMKAAGSNDIVYRIEKGQYELISTAHKTALKSYDPIIKSS